MLYKIKSTYTWIDSVKEFIYYKFIQPVKVFNETLVRIIKWLPILWTDRNWDWVFILIVLQTKLKFTRESLTKYGHHVNVKRDCKNIRIAEILLERLQNSDKYVEQEYKEHRIKYPKYDDLFNNELIQSNQESKDFKKNIIDKEEYMWKQDFDYLCKHLKKHIRSWWD